MTFVSTVGNQMRESRTIVGLFGCYDPTVPVRGPSWHGVVMASEVTRVQYIPVNAIQGNTSTHVGLILSEFVACELLKDTRNIDHDLLDFCLFVVGSGDPRNEWTRLPWGAAWVLRGESKFRYQEMIRDTLKTSLLKNPMCSDLAWSFQRSSILVEDDALALAALHLQGEDISDIKGELLEGLDPEEQDLEIQSALRAWVKS